MEEESNQVITEYDYLLYQKGKLESRVNKIWKEILKQIPPNLRIEAEKKGFKLIQNEHIEEDGLAKYMVFKTPKASKELEDFMMYHSECYIVLLKR